MSGGGGGGAGGVGGAGAGMGIGGGVHGALSAAHGTHIRGEHARAKLEGPEAIPMAIFLLDEINKETQAAISMSQPSSVNLQV